MGSVGERPERKPVRLQGYNYSQEGMYFITICVEEKQNIFGEIVGCDALGAPRVQHTEIGEIVHKEILETPSHYSDIRIDKFIVMPNHVHMIIAVEHTDGAPMASHPTTARIPALIAMIKKKVNRECGKNIWQKSFHDHIIRDEKDCLRIWQYIDENPAK